MFHFALKQAKSSVNTGKTPNLPACTVCAILASATITCYTRSGATEKEKVLEKWIEDVNHRNSHVIMMVIQRQAKFSFDYLMAMEGKVSVNEEFNASRVSFSILNEIIFLRLLK